MKLRPILLSAAVATFAMISPAHSADPQGAAGVQLIKSFLKDIRGAMASRDPANVRAVAERYMDEDYVQHSRGLAPGREGFIKGMSTAVTGGPPPGAPPAGGVPSGPPPSGAAPAGLPPGAPPTPKDLYFLGDGEYVVWVSEGMEPGKLVFNMVRVVDGKMKEHWDSNWESGPEGMVEWRNGEFREENEFRGVPAGGPPSAGDLPALPPGMKLPADDGIPPPNGRPEEDGVLTYKRQTDAAFAEDVCMERRKHGETPWPKPELAKP